LQILLLAQHVSGTTMPIIRSSRILYSGCCLWYFVLWFSSCRMLRVISACLSDRQRRQKLFWPCRQLNHNSSILQPVSVPLCHRTTESFHLPRVMSITRGRLSCVY